MLLHSRRECMPKGNYPRPFLVVLAECRGVGSHLIKRSRDGVEVRSCVFLPEVPWSGLIVICH